MTAFLDDIAQQPEALRDLAHFYADGDGLASLRAIPVGRPLLLTGMGASFHAAAICALHLHSLGIPAQFLEATDLLHFSRTITDGAVILYISQSGASAEVHPIIQAAGRQSSIVAVTNDHDSPLARHASLVLPLRAGPEALVATKTYVNSLALLWLLARQHAGALERRNPADLLAVAERCQALIAERDAIVPLWLDTLRPATSIVFLGHGPHALTARQAAMMMSEWARIPALHSSIGAFRHGLIESADPSMAVVLFASPGPTHRSALALADELAGYGVRLLLVEQGVSRLPGEAARAPAPLDEFLSPILDVIPAQLFVDALARERGGPTGFRYISKVVSQL